MIPIKGVIAIQVRMAVRQAQQALMSLKGNLAALQASSGTVASASAAMSAAQLRAAKSSETLGNRVKASGIAAMKSASQFQWFSRQLMYNWGIPLIAAGAIATKWSLETQAAMTRVAKVYGDVNMDEGEKKAELDSLAKYFEAVSNRYGMLQKDVIAIGAAWAAAGAEAVGLAKATQLTIETMILGEMNAEEATKSLIAIQEAWRVNAAGLRDTIAELNMVENQTAVNMSGLIEAFVRTGSSARIAGLSTGDLAALIAGLVPAAGNATTAGNSLKTILSRIAAPTRAAENAIKALGYNIDGTAWRSMDARKRLEGMAEAFSKMDRNQQQAIATDIAGRQQYNRFVQVMDALADRNSAYWRAQEALRRGKEKINGVTGLQIQYEKELNAVLESNPQAMKMVLARLQNLAIKGFAPLIPYIIAVMQYLVNFAQWLGNLPPEVKKLIAAMILLIVALTAFSKVIAAFRLLGPAVTILFGSLLNGAAMVGKVFSGLGRLILTPLKMFNIFASKSAALAAAAASGGKGILGGFAASILASRAGIAKAFSFVWSFVRGQIVAMTFWLAGPGFKNFATSLALMFTRSAAYANKALVIGFLALRTNLFKIVGSFSLIFPRILAFMTSGYAAISASRVALQKLLVGGFVAIRSGIFKAIGSIVLIWPMIIKSLSRGGTLLIGFIRTLPAKIAAGLRALGPMIWRALLAIGPLLMKIGPILLRFLTGPWGLALSAIVALAVRFRDQIGQVFTNVVNFFSQAWSGVGGQVSGISSLFSKFTQFLINCFYALPREIQNAMQAVVNIVYQAAMAVYKLFSYLNPFARHSPSLVENVTNGMAVIEKQFSSVSAIQGPIDRAYSHIKKFKDLMASFRNGKAVDLEFADDLKVIAKVAPQAMKAARAMIADIKALQNILDGIEVELKAQQKVVDEWSKKLDEANFALKEQQDILDSLSEEMDFYKSLIDDAQSTIDKFASTSITGMGALNDQIQANTQAQNELKLAMMQMDQAAGGFDSLEARLAALNGEFERLTASRDELVSAGAGSDILGYYDEQINAINDQKNAIYDSADAYTKMSQRLKELEREGELLDLTKSVNYDPLLYEIEKLTRSQEELSFDEIVSGILDAQQTIDDYTPALNKATEAYKDQEAVVYSLLQARNAIERQYDIEAAKLDKIKDRYNAVNDAISDLREALNQMSLAAGKADKSLGKKGIKGGIGGAGGAGGGYPGGGIKGGGDTFGIKDLEKGGWADIDRLTKGMEDAMNALDLTGPIKEKWNAAVKWWMDNIQPAFNLIGKAIADWWSKIDWSGIVGDNSWLASWWQGVVEWFSGLGSELGSIFGSGGLMEKIFGDDFKTAWDELIKGFQQFGKEIAPGFMEFWESVKPFIDSVGKATGDTAKVVLTILGAAITVVLKLILWVWNSGIQPLLKGVGALLGAAFKIVGGVMDLISGIIQGDGTRIVDGFKKILGGLWDAVWGAFKAVVVIVFNLVGGLFKELWQMFSAFFPDIAKSIESWWSGLRNAPIIGDIINGIISAFQWLYDVLLGHSIIPDIVNGVVEWFGKLVGWALKPILTLAEGVIGAFKWIYDGIKNSPIGEAASGVADGIKGAFSGAWDWVTSPFRRAEDDVQRSFSNIDGTVADSTGNMEDNFDDVFKSFKDMTKDINKAAKTDWKTIRRNMNKEIDQLPKDQQKITSKMVKEFLKIGEDIQKKNPALWDKIKKGITDPTGDAVKEVSSDAFDIKKAITGLGDVKIPSQWSNLSRTISDPTGKAARNVKDDIRAMNRAIGGLDGGLPREWRNLRNTIVDPVRDAKAALSKIKFSTSNITAPLGRIVSAADRVTSALNRMINKWRQADSRLGLKYGGAVAIDKLNAYANTLVPGHATGGAVHGPGGPTSDKVLRYLSSGEHVMTAAEVAKLGGQGSVYALRGFIRRNNVSTEELIKAYKATHGNADGGAILRFGIATERALSTSARRMNSATVSRAATVENRTVHIENATFEFPNVKNGKDAKEFFDNLEVLIGS